MKEVKVEILENHLVLCYRCGQTFDITETDEFVRYLYHECFDLGSLPAMPEEEEHDKTIRGPVRHTKG